MNLLFLTNISIYLQIVSVSSGQRSPRGGSVVTGEDLISILAIIEISKL